MNGDLVKKESTIPIEQFKKKKGNKNSLNIIMVSPKPNLVKRLKKTAIEQNTNMGALVEAIIEEWFLLKKKDENERLNEIEKKLDELTLSFKNGTSIIRKNIQSMKTKSETERIKSKQTTL